MPNPWWHRNMTPENVCLARWEHHFGKGVNVLAREYNTPKSSMSMLLRGLLYPECGGPIAGKKTNMRLGPAGARSMREDWARTFATEAELGKKYGVSAATAHHVLRGNIYKDAGGPIRYRMA